MAKQIKWSENALQDRFQILDYWNKRTGNKKYSTYLDNCFKSLADTISKYPHIGRVYKDSEYRFLVKDNFLLFYEFNKDAVSILAIFDSEEIPNQ